MTVLRSSTLPEIVDAIACHGVRAAPHLPALRALVNRRELPDATFERVESATRKVAQIAALARPDAAPIVEDG